MSKTTYPTVTITKAQSGLSKLCRNKQPVLITAHDKPVSVLLPIEDYEAMIETMDLLSNPKAMRTLRAAKAGMPVTTAHPVINANTTGVIKQGWIGIIKGIVKKTAQAAHAYINLFIDSDFQREFAIKEGVVPENVNALRDLAKDPVLAKMLILDEKNIDKMLHIDYSNVNIGDWYDQWSRTIAK